MIPYLEILLIKLQKVLIIQKKKNLAQLFQMLQFQRIKNLRRNCQKKKTLLLIKPQQILKKKVRLPLQLLKKKNPRQSQRQKVEKEDQQLRKNKLKLKGLKKKQKKLREKELKNQRKNLIDKVNYKKLEDWYMISILMIRKKEVSIMNGQYQYFINLKKEHKVN